MPRKQTTSLVDDHPLLTGRHVDNLIDAVHEIERALERAAKESQTLLRQAVLAQQHATAALERIATHTENLPALVELLREKSNGHAHQVLEATANGE